MTNQEAFNKVWRHFVVNRHGPGFDSSRGKCMYRTPSGNRCAIGCLIPRGKYRKDFEMNTVDKVVVACGLGLSPCFYRPLQSVHDDAAVSFGGSFRGRMRAGLRAFAAEWNLTVPA